MALSIDVYEKNADWWDKDGMGRLVLDGINPCRFGYFSRVLDNLKIEARGKKVLDIGCGGGYLAEEFARIGCLVSGIDPSASSIQSAKKHAGSENLEIDYQVGKAEALPYENESFDMITGCDVLEHVDDLKRVITECSRVLKPGGLFLYETVNRTFLSKIITVKLMQEWKWTAVLPEVHAFEQFIKPDELIAMFKGASIENKGMTGFGPGKNPIATISLIRDKVKGKISFGELGKALDFKEMKDLSINYMGFGIKS